MSTKRTREIRKKNWGAKRGVKQKSGGAMAHPGPLRIATDITIRCLRFGSQDVHQIRFQSRSKKFWNRWLKQYAIIIRSHLITIHIRIHYHFSTFSEYWKRSILQFDTNDINQKFGVYPISLFSDLCNVNYAVQIAVLTTKYKYVQQ